MSMFYVPTDLLGVCAQQRGSFKSTQVMHPDIKQSDRNSLLRLQLLERGFRQTFEIKRRNVITWTFSCGYNLDRLSQTEAHPDS